ncbi:hypothetical protein HDV05_001475 [Chytridiales sp. JEL 0842]|nr:hypothetical protein HDV05_001475 [Chytridiales sp. JEL 0842]
MKVFLNTHHKARILLLLILAPLTLLTLHTLLPHSHTSARLPNPETDATSSDHSDIWDRVMRYKVDKSTHDEWGWGGEHQEEIMKLHHPGLAHDTQQQPTTNNNNNKKKKKKKKKKKVSNEGKEEDEAGGVSGALLEFCMDLAFGIETSDDATMHKKRVDASWLQALCGAPVPVEMTPYDLKTLNFVQVPARETSAKENYVWVDRVVGVEKGERGAGGCEFLNGLWTLYDKFPDAKWYIMTDDHSVVAAERVKRFLEFNSHTELIAFAAQSSTDQGKINIDNGYIISKTLVDKLAFHKGSEQFSIHCENPNTPPSSIFADLVEHAGGKAMEHEGFIVYNPSEPPSMDSNAFIIKLGDDTTLMSSLSEIFNPPKNYNFNKNEDDPSANHFTQSHHNPCTSSILQQQRRLVDIYTQLLPQVTKVALLGFPDHSNKGDSAIWVGERLLLQHLGIEVVYMCALMKDFNNRALEASLGPPSPHTAILLHGGGNFGDLYPRHQELRNHIVSLYKNYKIVSFPQTLHFPLNSRKSTSLLSKVKKVYASHGDLTLVARDHVSFEKMHKFFGRGEGTRVFLAPDAAFMIGARYLVDVATQQGRGWKSVDVLVHQRTDAEGIEAQRIGEVWEGLRSVGSFALDDWIGWDVGVGRGDEWDLKALKRLKAGLTFLSQGKVVVTNRLHGHILLTLLGAPHVLLDNLHGKVSSYHSTWTSECPNVRMAKSVEEAIKLVGDVVRGDPWPSFNAAKEPAAQEEGGDGENVEEEVVGGQEEEDEALPKPPSLVVQKVDEEQEGEGTENGNENDNPNSPVDAPESPQAGDSETPAGNENAESPNGADEPAPAGDDIENSENNNLDSLKSPTDEPPSDEKADTEDESPPPQAENNKNEDSPAAFINEPAKVENKRLMDENMIWLSGTDDDEDGGKPENGQQEESAKEEEEKEDGQNSNNSSQSRLNLAGARVDEVFGSENSENITPEPVKPVVKNDGDAGSPGTESTNAKQPIPRRKKGSRRKSNGGRRNSPKGRNSPRN